mgnify:CR=1 FL=1
MRLSGAGKVVLGAVVICVLLTLSLYLWSPWHQHTVQGRKTCAFLQFEQSSGLEAGAPVIPESPTSVLACPPAESVPVRGFERVRQHGFRAPPAI